MRAVLDTNVAISAAINPDGTPGRVILSWEADSFTWVTSEALLEELERTFGSPKVKRYFAWLEQQVHDFLSRVRRAADVASPVTEIRRITADPPDNRVLEAAVEGDADYIVTGDRHLLDLERHEGIEIVTPAQFLAILAEARNP
jgi:putative PIN family toxin of toxin-antitoxin system